MCDECYFIDPAAGSCTRMGSTVPKLLMDIEGLPVISRTLDSLTGFCKELYAEHVIGRYGVVLSTSSELLDKLGGLCRERYDDFPFIFTLGGSTRTESVGRGVEALAERNPSDSAIVMVHDGARCLVTGEELQSVFDGVKKDGICAGAVPVKSTLKEVSIASDGTINVLRTPDRSTLYEIMTPQGFTYEKIKACYDYAALNSLSVTDDTAIAEMMGYPVTLASGKYSNIKITTAEDIAIASQILLRRNQNED